MNTEPGFDHLFIASLDIGPASKFLKYEVYYRKPDGMNRLLYRSLQTTPSQLMLRASRIYSGSDPNYLSGSIVNYAVLDTFSARSNLHSTPHPDTIALPMSLMGCIQQPELVMLGR